MAHDPRPTTALVPIPYTNTPALAGRQEPPTVWRVAWQCKREIYPNRGQTFFPDGPRGAVYEITITGTIRYCWKTWPYPRDKITVSGRADALYNTTAADWFDPRDTGKFEERHEWFLVNGNYIRTEDLRDKNGHRDRFGLKADRDDHIYRLHVTDAGKPLVFACEAVEGDSETFKASGYFTVSVTARVLEEKRERRRPRPRMVVVADDPPPVVVPPTPDDIRERDLRSDEVRAKDFHARLMAIALREKEALDNIDRLEGLSDDQKNNYRQEVKDFAAGEMAKLAENRNERASNVKTI